MATTAGARHEPERVGVQFRVTAEDRERLRREAAEAGLTQTQLFELRMFGAAKPVRQYGRPRKPLNPNQEVLPQSA